MQWRFVFGIFSLTESAVEAVVEAMDEEGQRKRKSITVTWRPESSPGLIPISWLEAVLAEARGQ